MFAKLSQIWKIKDLRNKILYVLALLAVYRLVAHIPMPGVDMDNLRKFFDSNDVLGLLNIFSGGGMKNFSLIMLGVAPYITASIIIQLLTMIVPSLEELSKEGEYGQKKINQYTRILTVPLAVLQSFAMINLLSHTANPIITDTSLGATAVIMLSVTAGTIFLMWLGELISEKKIGNGISLLIFAGIVSSLPAFIQRIIITFDISQIFTIAGFLVVFLITIVGVVYMTEGQRNIPVSYARQVRGGKLYGGSSTHLPLRVNMAGVIPIIFAISMLLIPPMLAQLFMRAKTEWLVSASNFIFDLFRNQLFYGLFYFVLVIIFTYFYTSVIFHPDKIAENLQKQGGFIPGIRPGVATAQYLSYTMTRIILVGAVFLGVIAVLPILMQSFTGTQNLAVGGTSLLIVVSVVIDIVNQINAQLSMREYEQF